MSDNTLKIEADSLDLELSGDADYVIKAYEGIRRVAMEQFEQTLAAREKTSSSDTSQPEPQKNKAPSKGTNPHFPIDGLRQQVAAGRELVELHLQFVVCTEMYRRVAALSRDDFRDSIFGAIIDPESLSKLYLTEDAAILLEDQIEFDKTLWRELTKAGHEVVHGDGDTS